MGWKLKRTIQCAKCPWKVSTDPYDIPNGYDPQKHANLANTISRGADLRDLSKKEMRVMCCHEDHDAHCIGWLVNQMGPGNNIALRFQLLSCDNLDEVKTVGEQHQRFEDTLPE